MGTQDNDKPESQEAIEQPKTKLPEIEGEVVEIAPADLDEVAGGALEEDCVLTCGNTKVSFAARV
jgi:hypothetical protein